MIRTPRPAGRPGVTLTEVLVAMFVMAIGMISLLTLFPLGAMQVGQALRDDRATQLARQADAYIRQTWRNDALPKGGNLEGYYWAMDDPYLVVKYPDPTPNSTRNVMRFVGSSVSPNSWYNTVPMIPPFSTFGAATVGTPNNRPTPFTLTDDAVRVAASNNEVTVDSYSVTVQGPSFPVFFDPAGVAAYAGRGKLRGWVAATTPSAVTTHPNTLRLPRRTCQLVNPINPLTPTVNSTSALSGAVFDLTSLTDDMAFNANGAPVGGSELGRQGRYSWAAVIQRPANELRTIADLTVLVFDKRPALPQDGDELVVAPDIVAPATTVAKGSRSVTITLPNRTGDTSPVLLKRGGWLIDGTIDTTTATNTRRQFFAYRVSGYTEGTVGATSTQYDVDLETPLKADLNSTSQLYLFAGLIEVYARPQLRPDSPY